MAEKRVLGIDFTSNEIRLVEVVQKGKGASMEHFAVGEIPPGVFAAGKVVEVDRLRTVIKDLMATHRFKAKRCVLGISGKFGVTRLITLPKMNVTQTRDAIQLQLSQYVPFSPADTSYDYKVLREIKEEDQLQQEILLAATRRSTLDGILRALRKAGLQVAAVKITTLTSFNLFEESYFDADHAVAFCDVRDNVTDISFVAENLFRLSRSVEFGSASIVEAVRRKLNISNEETMEYLRYNPVDLTEVFSVSAEAEADIGGLAGIATGEEPRAKVVRDAVIRTLSTFVNELMRSIRYFESQQKRRARVGRVVIFGNVTFLKNLQAYIAEQTGLEVVVTTEIPAVENHLQEIDLRLYHDHASEGTVAGSLAYDAVTARRIEFNLMPREALVRRKTYNALKYVLGLYVVLVGIALAYWFQKYEVAEDYKTEIAKTDRDLQKVQPFFQQSEDLKAEINKVAPKLEGVMTITKKMLPWPVLNTEIARMMVDEAWLDEFSLNAKDKELVIHCWTFELQNFMKQWVNFHNSRIYSMKDEKIKIDLGNIEDDEGPVIGGGTGGGGGGSGASMPVPGRSAGRGNGIGGFNLQPAANFKPARSTGMGPMRQAMGMDARPQPMYGLPEFPQGVGTIENFWAGRNKPFLIMIESDHTLSIRDDFLNAQEDIYEGVTDLKVQ
ncbi:MAG: type IV pilus assembly protein PilM [bacterium]